MVNQQHRPTLLDVPISFFEPDQQRGNFANVPTQQTTLRRIVSTQYYRPLIESIRAEPDPSKQAELKKQLPAITPVALLHHRKRDTSFADKISQQWPLLMGDVDRKDNPSVDMAELKIHLARLPYALLCAYSVRGGIWFVVRLPDQQTPESLAAHFRYLQKVFSEKFGVQLDSSKGGNPTDLRFVSCDVDPYINENATVMAGAYTPPKPNPRPIDYSRLSRQDEDELLPRLVRFTQTAGEGQRHATLLKAATVAGGYVATGRMDEQTAVYALETVASEWPTFSKSQRTIRDGIRYGQNKPIYADADIRSSIQSQPRTVNRQLSKIAIEQEGEYADCQQQQTARDSNIETAGLDSLVEVLDLINESKPPVVEVDQTPASARPDAWDIADLEAFFATVTLPSGPVELSQCETISDVPKFVESHLQYVRANNGRRAYVSYLKRLQHLRDNLSLCAHIDMVGRKITL